MADQRIPADEDTGFGRRSVAHAGDIEVARCPDGKRLETLPFMAWQALSFGDTFEALDINFDGYLDLSVRTEYAGKFSRQSYWIYDPSAGRFVQNELTRQLGELLNVDFDPAKREISTFSFVGNEGGDIHRYRIERGRLRLVHQEIWDSTDRTLTVSDLVAGCMRVTEVRRFDAQRQPVK
jgi:hypothetical protein